MKDKRVILLVIALLFIAGLCSAQQLNPESLRIKEQFPVVYETIEHHAIQVWGDYEPMVNRYMNTQIQALLTLENIDYESDDRKQDIIIGAIDTAKYEGCPSRKKVMKGDDPLAFYKLHVDWHMVLHIYLIKVRDLNER